ncbi:MAG: GTPase, partial [Rubripirellula sp.]
MSNSATDTQTDTTLGKPGLEYLTRIRRATVNVLGNSPAGREVLELCDDHAEARARILDDRSSGLTVVAAVGATGQGKSWIIRQLLGNRETRQQIKSGNNADQATEQLIWVGPAPPDNLDTVHEQYVHCSMSEMQPIGTSYLLVDAPGATDDRKAIARVAKRALSLASVMLLVVRRDQIRSETIAALATASEGTIVIPVINAVRSKDGHLAA